MLTASLSGTGTQAASVPQAALTPALLSFTTVAGTTPATQSATLTNSGTAAPAISSIAIGGANASSFTRINTCGASLAAGATCAFTVSLSTTSAGSYAETLSVTDNAFTPTQTKALSATLTAVTPAANFTVAATPPTESVTTGRAATYAANVASTGGNFTNAVTLTATGLPPGATVTFSPASVTPGASGAQSTMTVQTAARQTASSREGSSWPFTTAATGPVFAAVLLLIPAWRSRRRSHSSMRRAYFTGAGCLLVLLGSLIGTMAALTGCGGGFALPTTQPNPALTPSR